MSTTLLLLGASLVQSRLDYANSIMYGMSASNMHKLQSVQNSLTRVVLPSLRHLSAGERFSYLLWLPVHYRIQFKIATLTYKTLATCQPSYLYNLLQLHQPSRTLRFSTQQLLQVPYLILVVMPSATAILQHGISFLPPSKIVHPSLCSFKRHLKSHLIARLINNDNTLRLAIWWLARSSDSCLRRDYTQVIANFLYYFLNYWLCHSVLFQCCLTFIVIV